MTLSLISVSLAYSILLAIILYITVLLILLLFFEIGGLFYKFLLRKDLPLIQVNNWKGLKRFVIIALVCTVPYCAVFVNLLFVYFHKTFKNLFCLYAVYFVIYRKPWTGGHDVKWFRDLSFWDHVISYFPIKTVKLYNDVNFLSKPTLFGYHPHGILPTGFICSFGCNTKEFRSMFPNTTVFAATLNPLLSLPILREWLILQGFISVNSSSISAALNEGRSVAIAVGGAREALFSDKYRMSLIIWSRKGFFKKALNHGCQLVPVIGYGENEVYENLSIERTIWIHVSNLTKMIFGYTLPIFQGRSILHANIGLIPKNVPVTVVFGKPIDVPKNESPTTEDIQSLQKLYVEYLQDMHEQCQKMKIGEAQNIELHIT